MSSTSPYREIVVGTDGSPTAARAVQSAIQLARVLGCTLTVATAWYRNMPDEPVPSEKVKYPGGSPAAMEARWAEETSYGAAVLARSEGVDDARSVAPEGSPADAILRLAEERRDSLVVVGTVGLSERRERLLGNVPHQITHHSIRDVLLIRSSEAREEPRWTRVALATDGSRTAAHAVRQGLALAEAIGSEPVLLTITPSGGAGDDVLDVAASELGSSEGLGLRVAVGRDVAATLSEVARDYDLLVLGNKGMSGPSRLLGSVANHVTHDLPTDLLLVNTTR